MLTPLILLSSVTESIISQLNLIEWDHLPPPQVAEQSEPGVASQWYRGREHDEPSPPHTPHSSTRRVEPTRKSQPTRCEQNKYIDIILYYTH
jgi:hypothetical protein